MRVVFVVNDVSTEQAKYTTVRLATAAHSMGHDVWLTGVADFTYDCDGRIFAHARATRDREIDEPTAYLSEIQDPHADTERICLGDMDVVMLRYDPADEANSRPWAQTAGILFAQLAARELIVLNDPRSLAHALNKTYFQHFPERVRPRTLISRRPEEIKSFVQSMKGRAVLKPLQGSGGRNVFMVDDHHRENLNQIIDAILRDGYVVAQEYLAAASEGDIRLLVMNGHALEHEGKFAMFRRVAQGGDLRSNTRAGAHVEPAEMTDEIVDLVEAVRPQLVKDGMFFVGLDIVGDKLMEVNVFSPGGLGSASLFQGVDFTIPVIEAIERKVAYRRQYRSGIDNTEIAIL